MLVSYNMNFLLFSEIVSFGKKGVQTNNTQSSRIPTYFDFTAI